MIMSMKSDPLLSWLSLTVGGAGLQDVESTCPISCLDSSIYDCCAPNCCPHSNYWCSSIKSDHYNRLHTSLQTIHTPLHQMANSYPVKHWIIIQNDSCIRQLWEIIRVTVTRLNWSCLSHVRPHSLGLHIYFSVLLFLSATSPLRSDPIGW